MLTKINLPEIESYNPRTSSANYGLNSLKIILPEVTLYFSYKTLIAFVIRGERYVSQNDWGTTTGKHLNWIDGGMPEAKKARLTRKAFEAKYREIFGQPITTL